MTTEVRTGKSRAATHDTKYIGGMKPERPDATTWLSRISGCAKRKLERRTTDATAGGGGYSQILE